jgi:hypothetical protein
LAKKENLSPSSLLPSQKVPSCLKLGSYGFSNFKVDKILCTLEIFGKIKLVAAHSSLQLSVASTLYTSLLHHLSAALHARHTALRYFLPTKPYLPSARCVFSFFFSSSTSGRQSQAAAAAFVARSALLLYCLLAAAAALLCCCATICLTPVLLLCYLLAAAAGEPEPPLPFQAAAKVERQCRPSNTLCTGPRRPILRRAAPARCRRPPSQSTAMPPPSSPGAAPCNSCHRPARRQPPLGLLLS